MAERENYSILFINFSVEWLYLVQEGNTIEHRQEIVLA